MVVIMYNKNIFKIALKEMVILLKNNKIELEQKPDVLLSLMKTFYDIYESSSYHFNKKFDLSSENPVFFLTQLFSKGNQRYLTLINGAYSLNYRLNELDQKSIHFEQKRNKKFSDYKNFWMKKTKDESYLQKREEVFNNLFCVIGNGKCWTKEGYIDSKLDNEDDEIIEQSIFFPIKKNKPSQEIKKQLKLILTKDIKFYIRHLKLTKQNQQKVESLEVKKYHMMLSRMKKIMGKHRIDTNNETKTDFVFYEMSSKYSLLSNFPNNTHKTYLEAMTEVCWLILENKKESLNNKNIAKQVLTKINRII